MKLKKLTFKKIKYWIKFLFYFNFQLKQDLVI